MTSCVIDIGNTVLLSTQAVQYSNGDYVEKELYTIQIRTPDGEQEDIPGTDSDFILDATTGRYTYSGFYTTMQGTHYFRIAVVTASGRGAKWIPFAVRETPLRTS